jgi:hypothetical protein
VQKKIIILAVVAIVVFSFSAIGVTPYLMSINRAGYGESITQGGIANGISSGNDGNQANGGNQNNDNAQNNNQNNVKAPDNAPTQEIVFAYVSGKLWEIVSPKKPEPEPEKNLNEKDKNPTQNTNPDKQDTPQAAQNIATTPAAPPTPTIWDVLPDLFETLFKTRQILAFEMGDKTNDRTGDRYFFDTKPVALIAEQSINIYLVKTGVSYIIIFTYDGEYNI